MITIATVNLKGGTAKTTTTAFVLHVLHEAGLKTLGVDADEENESLAGWQTAADWPFPVIGMAVPNLHKQLPGVTGDRFDATGIDTPPMKERRSVVRSALIVATHVIVPIAPTPMEFDRLPAVRELVDEAADLRPDGKPPVLVVLLNRTVSNAASTGAYRAQIVDSGFHVLKAEVGRRERYAQAYGDPIVNATNSEYGDAVGELLDMETSA